MNIMIHIGCSHPRENLIRKLDRVYRPLSRHYYNTSPITVEGKTKREAIANLNTVSVTVRRFLCNNILLYYFLFPAQ
ncbi:hypothetical protein QTP88_012439 [Uroleucon formosanum]